MAKKSITLAEAKLRRNELQKKAQILKELQDKDIFEIKDAVGTTNVKVPKLTASQVLHEYDWHTRRADLLDLVIKRADFLTEVMVDPMALEDYPLGGEITKPKVQRKRRVKRQPTTTTNEGATSNKGKMKTKVAPSKAKGIEPKPKVQNK